MAGSLSGSPIALESASSDTAGLLSNLLGLYMHDMSEMFPVEVDADGVFRYEKLALYWSKPDTHFPFLIYTAGQIAGFVLATRGSPASEDPGDLDVAEFFVLRSQRRRGVGREAAFLLWGRIPGRWVVRVSTANRSGLSFWRRTIGLYTGDRFAESRRPVGPHEWHVFTFGSPMTMEDRMKTTEAAPNTARLTRIAPQFLVEDLDAAIAYYQDKLGFGLEFCYESFYASVSRDGLGIHLKCAPKSLSERARRKQEEHLDAYISVTGVATLHDELRSRGALITKSLETQPWSCIEFHVEDPDGYILCFSEPIV